MNLPPTMDEVADVIFLNVAREQRAEINAANKIMDEQLQALLLAYTALVHAAEALTYYNALAFERDGRPAAEAISRAINAIIGARP